MHFAACMQAYHAPKDASGPMHVKLWTNEFLSCMHTALSIVGTISF